MAIVAYVLTSMREHRAYVKACRFAACKSMIDLIRF